MTHHRRADPVRCAQCGFNTPWFSELPVVLAAAGLETWGLPLLNHFESLLPKSILMLCNNVSQVSDPRLVEHIPFEYVDQSVINCYVQLCLLVPPWTLLYLNNC